MWSSLAVLVGLAGVALGSAWADAAAALIVALFVCLAGWRLGKRTIDTLTDAAPAGAADRITAIAGRMPGVVAVERVRARPAAARCSSILGRGEPDAAARPGRRGEGTHARRSNATSARGNDRHHGAAGA